MRFLQFIKRQDPYVLIKLNVQINVTVIYLFICQKKLHAKFCG